MRDFLSQERRFWKFVRQSDGCWEWLGFRDPCNYGRFHWDTRKPAMLAHRAAMTLHLGRWIDKDEWVLHRCDNPACVNPEHLYIGTPKQNSSDMVARGRSRRGSRCRNAKLTEEQVIEMRRRYSTGERMKPLSDEYGVNIVTTFNIINRVNWGWLSDA